MFAAIEGASPALVKSPRTLEETATIMFAGDEARRPTRCGNAGNDAFVSYWVVHDSCFSSPVCKVQPANPAS